VSEYDQNSHSQLSSFNKEVKSNKLAHQKQEAKDQEEWDAIPKDTKEAVKRKEQRHEQKVSHELKLKDKAQRLAKREHMDVDEALSEVKEKDAIK
jgi:hypothetical protein